MAKYVCTRKCFISVGDGKARLFKVGEVHDFDKAPSQFFRCLSGKKAEKAEDLESVSRDELLEGPYKIAELRRYAQEHYDVKLKGTSKEDVVESFLDARFRHLEEHELEGVM